MIEGQFIRAQMDTKLFTLDKNYILREVQDRLRTQLLLQLVKDVKSIYIKRYNPLGLIDETIIKIQDDQAPAIDYLESFYYELAGIYRLKYGENQLEFLFDGSSHHSKYTMDWKRKFRKWMQEFIRHKHFLRAILEGSYLMPEEHTQHRIQVRLKLFLEQQFHLRVYKYRGIRKLRSA